LSVGGDERLRILVVDDDEVDRKAVLRALAGTLLKVEVVEASGVDAAQKALRENEFDCILVDYYLPGGDGTDVIKAIGVAAGAPPFIVLTGRGDEHLAVELMKSGASDYLLKSGLDASVLAPSIRRALRVARAERAAKLAHAELETEALQLQELAAASIRVHAALSVDDTLTVTAHAARNMLVAHGAVATLDVPGGVPRVHSSVADRYPSVDDLRKAGVPWLEAPLLAHDGVRLGSVAVADPLRGSFRGSDETLLKQLAQTASIALEKARLFKAVQDASRMRDDVLAIVSHDLRSPLNTISMSAGLLREDVAGSELALVERIDRSVKRMNRMIADLLDASCIDEGKLAVVPRREQASAIIREAIDSIEPIAAARSCRVECPRLDESALVLADRHRLLQVFSNLLGNALKFSPPEGVVTVDVQTENALAVFSVVDQGPGIEAEHLGRLFDRYYKANAASREGAGLGLFIARGIVEAHKGSIRVESARGRGTRMVFTIPLAC
jgi:signal transduction histidine kinase